MLRGMIESLRNRGLRPVACLPLHPPLELVESFGLTPVVLWNLAGEFPATPAADRHIQNYACSVARHLSEFLISGGGALFDAVVFYNACDTLRNLPEILQGGMAEQGAGGVPFLRLHVPANWSDEIAARTYLSREIRGLMEQLVRLSGKPFSPEAFRDSIEKHSRARGLARRSADLVREGLLSCRDFSAALARTGFMTVDDRIHSLEALCAGDPPRGKGTGTASIPVALSGILPPPAEVAGFIEDAGLRVALNDIACEGRSIGPLPAPVDDPAAYYCEYYRGHAPCTTLLHTAEKRIAHLLEGAAASGARGFIFIGEKFCEYEYFEIVHLEKLLKERGIATLRLEFSRIQGGEYHDMKTRIEAFAEMLRG